MISQPITAFMANLHGAPMVAILTSLAVIGLLAVKIDGGQHKNAMMWFIGFLVTAGILVAVGAEGQAWFAGA